MAWTKAEEELLSEYAAEEEEELGFSLPRSHSDRRASYPNVIAAFARIGGRLEAAIANDPDWLRYRDPYEKRKQPGMQARLSQPSGGGMTRSQTMTDGSVTTVAMERQQSV